MENYTLTAAELAVFNNLSREQNLDVTLGTVLQAMLTLLQSASPTAALAVAEAAGRDAAAALDAALSASIESGTPTNAAAASGTLVLSGVVLDGETLGIGADVYEFCADDAQTVAAEGNIAVDIRSHVTASHGTLTIDTQPTAGDKVTIGTKVYTFVPVGTANADGEVSIGADKAEAQANLVAAINGTDEISTPHPLVSAAAFANDACVITALIGGVAGDAIATTETFTAETNMFATAVLGSGADCSAANAVTVLVAAITAYDTQGVGAADGDDDTVVLTADEAGVAGNSIALATDIGNGAFANEAAALAGGADGTVAVGPKAMMDETYLYTCLVDNSTSGQNWMRVSRGSTF